MHNLKYFLFMLGTQFQLIQINCQSQTSFPFNEFSLSINHTFHKDNNTIPLLGYGLGIYRNFMPDQLINVRIGLEFNSTRFFKYYIYENHFSYSKNVTYTIRGISLPVNIQFAVGNKARYYLDLGYFGESNLFPSKQGTIYTYFPFQEPSSTSFCRSANTNTANHGPSIGLGIEIYLAKYKLMIHSEYRHGGSISEYYNNKFINRYLRLSIGLKKTKRVVR